MIAIVCAFVALLFGGSQEFGSYAQGLAMLLIVGAAIEAIISQQLDFNAEPPTFFFWLLAVAMPMQSALVGLLRGTYFQVWYAFAFMLMVWCARILIVRHGLRRIIWAYLVASGFMIIFCLGFELNGLIDALGVTISDHGLMRFSPFDNHPNLVGHIFGLSASLAFLWLLLPASRFEKIAGALIGIVSLTFVLAASSRGGLFSAIIAVGATTAIWGQRGLTRMLRNPLVLLVSGVFTILSVIWVLQSLDWAYFSELLQLDSSDRGLDSGLTGRTEAWPIVLGKVSEDVGAVFWGFGFRSWDTWLEGDLAIDNSYIELIHDFGYVVAIVLFIQMLKSIREFYRRRNLAPDLYLAVCVSIFALTESVVARYMLGIGNPASLLSLFIFCSVPISIINKRLIDSRNNQITSIL